jgi:hypothetical protein
VVGEKLMEARTGQHPRSRELQQVSRDDQKEYGTEREEHPAKKSSLPRGSIQIPVGVASNNQPNKADQNEHDGGETVKINPDIQGVYLGDAEERDVESRPSSEGTGCGDSDAQSTGCECKGDLPHECHVRIGPSARNEACKEKEKGGRGKCPGEQGVHWFPSLFLGFVGF